jgi:Glycosyl transferase family 90
VALCAATSVRSVMSYVATPGVLRLATSLLAPAPRDVERATAHELQALVEPQLNAWRRASAAPRRYREALTELNATAPTVVIMQLRNGRVTVWDKPGATPQPHSSTASRVLLYQTFFQGVALRHALDIDLVFALDLSDGRGADTDVPLFGFQGRGRPNEVVVPDVDFFYFDWYRGEHDDVAYDDKIAAACFVGASTGGRISVQTVAEQSLPRLRAAAYFVGNPRVEFRIARAVQCKAPGARTALQAQPYFGASMPWREQLDYRFLLSMDGNGPACSRLVRGLHSNSVVVKYRSPNTLYYFPAMRAGRDYLEVTTDSEVEPIVRTELQRPGHHRPIAEAGQRFAQRYLNMTSVTQYTAMLLAQCARTQS